MNDPHIVSLTYRIKQNDSVSYRDPPALRIANASFEGELKDGRLTLRPKDHYPSAEAARTTADQFVRSWEVDCALRGYVIAFEYVSAEIVDRAPTPGAKVVSLSGVSAGVSIGAVTAHVTRSAYPAPPDRFVLTNEAEVLWDRLQSYRAGREKLIPMANFCLTWIERNSGVEKDVRKRAARRLNIDYEVLHILGGLLQKGDPETARKAPKKGDLVPLSPGEERWIEVAISDLVRRAGEVAAHDGTEPLRMSDLPPLD